MDFETFFNSLFSLLKNSENLYYLLYALATGVLTQVFKKFLVNKVNVEVLHKFDFAVIMPFVFGLGFAIIDLVCVRHAEFSLNFLFQLVVSATTVGALASIIFKFVSSLSGQSLKSLLKDDVFGVFYTELLYFGNVRRQLLNKEISFKDFLAQVKLISANAVSIYSTDDSVEVKKDKLAKLLSGLISNDNILLCADILNNSLIALCGTSAEEERN